MKAAVFYGRHDIRVEEAAMPQVGEKDVLIRVKACGICGTDVHIYEGDKGAADTTPPCILGHEFAGVVEQTGALVTTVRVGDRVCVDPNQLCHECDYCREGIGHFCEKMIGIGTTTNGGFAEFCAVKESQVYQLGDAISFEEGAMTEPVACCLHGMDMCEIHPASVVAVIGGGMIGQLMIQLAKLSGARKVILIEPILEKRKIGLQIGADIVIDPLEEDAAEMLCRQGIHRIHTVIECVGKPATIEQAIRLAGKKSVVMMFGLTKPDETISVKPFKIFQKEIVLKSSFINPYTQQRALDLIKDKKIDVKSMLYECCGLEELPALLGDAKRRAMGKYIIRP